MTNRTKGDPKVEWRKFIITTLLGIIAFIVGLTEYGATNFYSVRKPFLQMQSDLCKSATEAAARVATATDPEAWRKALDEFWALYWGPLAIVEDVDLRELPPPNPEKPQAGLAGKVEQLRANLENSKTPVTDSMIVFAAVASVQSTPPPAPKLNSATDLQKSAYAIARACQKSIHSVWNVRIWGGLREWWN